MNNKQFIKFANKIGLSTRSKIIPSDVDIALQQEEIQLFLLGLCETLTAENVISDLELANEREMCSAQSSDLLTEENEKVSAYSVDDLETEIKSYKHYIAALQKHNEELKCQLKGLDEPTNKLNQIATMSSVNRETVECKELISRFEKEMCSLTTCCSKLHNLICDQQNKPALLYQMPTDLFKSARNEFDSNIKNYILKQFGEKMVVLAGQMDPVTCSQANPRGLNQFVSGPQKQLYQQQCKEFDRLQAGYYSILRGSNFREAKLQGLQAAIKVVENWNNPVNAKEKQLDYIKDLTSEVAMLESQLSNIALNCSSHKVEYVVIGNFRMKQRRQQYYIEKLDVLEQILKQQLAIDKYTWMLSQTEKLLTDEVSKYLNATGKLIQDEVNCSTDILCTLKEISKVDTQMDIASLTLKASSYVPNEPGSAISVHSLDNDIKSQQQEQLHLVTTQLSDLLSRVADYDARGISLKESSDIITSQENAMAEVEHELEIQNKHLNSLLLDYKMEKDRHSADPSVQLKDQLWPLFIARPEELSSLLLKNTPVN